MRKSFHSVAFVVRYERALEKLRWLARRKKCERFIVAANHFPLDACTCTAFKSFLRDSIILLSSIVKLQLMIKLSAILIKSSCCCCCLFFSKIYFKWVIKTAEIRLVVDGKWSDSVFTGVEIADWTCWLPAVELEMIEASKENNHQSPLDQKTASSFFLELPPPVDDMYFTRSVHGLSVESKLPPTRLESPKENHFDNNYGSMYSSMAPQTKYSPSLLQDPSSPSLFQTPYPPTQAQQLPSQHLRQITGLEPPSFEGCCWQPGLLESTQPSFQSSSQYSNNPAVSACYPSISPFSWPDTSFSIGDYHSTLSSQPSFPAYMTNWPGYSSSAVPFVEAQQGLLASYYKNG